MGGILWEGLQFQLNSLPNEHLHTFLHITSTSCLLAPRRSEVFAYRSLVFSVATIIELVIKMQIPSNLMAEPLSLNDRETFWKYTSLTIGRGLLFLHIIP